MSSLMVSAFPTTSTIGYMLYCAARVYLYHLFVCEDDEYYTLRAYWNYIS